MWIHRDWTTIVRCGGDFVKTPSYQAKLGNISMMTHGCLKRSVGATMLKMALQQGMLRGLKNKEETKKTCHHHRRTAKNRFREEFGRWPEAMK